MELSQIGHLKANVLVNFNLKWRPDQWLRLLTSWPRYNCCYIVYRVSRKLDWLLDKRGIESCYSFILTLLILNLIKSLCRETSGHPPGLISSRLYMMLVLESKSCLGNCDNLGLNILSKRFIHWYFVWWSRYRHHLECRYCVAAAADAGGEWWNSAADEHKHRAESVARRRENQRACKWQRQQLTARPPVSASGLKPPILRADHQTKLKAVCFLHASARSH